MSVRLVTLAAPILLALSCAPAATPERTPTSAPAAATPTPTEAAAPTPKPEAKTAEAGEPPTFTPAPTPTPDLRVQIVARGEAILVLADPGRLLPASVVQGAREITGVEAAGGYLLAALPPVPLVGVAPGSPLLIFRGEEAFEARLTEGSELESEGSEALVAIAGRQVVQEDFTAPEGMAGMVHAFQIGQSFLYPGSDLRLRVVGRYVAGGDPELERMVLTPLAPAEEIAGAEGLSHLWIRLAPGADRGRVEAALRAAILEARGG